MSYYCGGDYTAGSCKPTSGVQHCNQPSDCASGYTCIQKVPLYDTLTHCQLGSDPNYDCGFQGSKVNGYPPVGHTSICVPQ